VILGLETSCDDTCAAVVDHRGRILSNVISSQEVHDAYGGVVPEIASRQHLQHVNVVVDDALARAGITLADVSTVAATRGPGLVGALLVGFATAKAIAVARGLPLVPVDHLQGHVAANFLTTADGAPGLEPPFLCLVVSGGHSFVARVDDHRSFTVLGRTLDDAAGEALDKGARMLGLPFPGGPHVERLAAGGDPHAFAFPLARGVPGLDMSFAGLKTALLYAARDLDATPGTSAAEHAADLAASFQHAVVEQLARRVERALEQTGLDRLAIGGGVAANGPLRARLLTLAPTVHVPDRALCTDNAAMIAGAARYLDAASPADVAGLDVYGTDRRAL
jgi:N6-L-threonylcarbamoyladenine synthase